MLRGEGGEKKTEEILVLGLFSTSQEIRLKVNFEMQSNEIAILIPCSIRIHSLEMIEAYEDDFFKA